MIDPAKLAYAVTYLNRTKTLEQIKTLADTAAATLLSGKTKIAITSTQMEGGGGSGEIEFEAAIVGMACEQIIAQQEPLAAAKMPVMGTLIVNP